MTFKKLCASSAHIPANSANTTADTINVANPSPVPTRPSKYNGYADPLMALA